MFSKLHDRLGTAGLAVAVVALVAALSGTAFAATKLNSTQKKEVEKIAKKYAGKNGKNGADGAPGATGPAGAAGKDGTNGAPGTAGTNGKGVVVGNPTLGECPEGGATVEVEGTPASKKKVCNGAEGDEGPEGPEGSPWTAGGTLPSGKTETGSFSVANLAGEALEAVSFPIPLAAGIAGANVHKTGDAGFATSCPGSAANPTAVAGHFCVYTAGTAAGTVEIAAIFKTDAGNSETPGTAKSGAMLYIGGEAYIWGTWAVTAP